MSRRLIVLMVIVFTGMAVFGVVSSRSAERKKRGAQILDSFVQATGGAMAYQSIQTMVITGQGSFDGDKVDIDEYRSAPSRYYASMSNKKLDIVQGTDGAVAWTTRNNRTDVLVGDSRADMLRYASMDGDVRWRDFFKSAEYMGTATFANKTCHKVVITPNEGKPRTRYYDCQTSYLVGEEGMLYARDLPPQPYTKTYDGYASYGGVLMPTRTAFQAGGHQISATIQQVVVNSKVPDEQFERPQAVKLQLIAMPGYLRNAAGER